MDSNLYAFLNSIVPTYPNQAPPDIASQPNTTAYMVYVLEEVDRSNCPLNYDRPIAYRYSVRIYGTYPNQVAIENTIFNSLPVEWFLESATTDDFVRVVSLTLWDL